MGEVILGSGIDIVDCERIQSSIDRFGERFLNRIFHPAEVDYCQKQKFPSRHLAARFAAKEAVSKTFGTGIGGELGWLDMEVFRRESGEPEILLTGAAAAFAERKGLAEVKISLTHAKLYAAANAVVMART